MIQLPNGCRVSRLTVFPKNWRSRKATVKKPWSIFYRFYDPEIPKPKQVAIRSMNQFHDLAARQQATEDLLAQEMDLLTRQGYNPCRSQFMPAVATKEFEVNPLTPIVPALRAALGKVRVTHLTMIDMRSVLKGIEKAIANLHFSHMTIGQVSRKHIKAILEESGRINKRWSARRYNLYRAYLSRIYKELIEMEAVEVNPVRDIQTMVQVKNIRETLTDDERARISEYLHANHYPFWRFVQIFFRSGARETELMKLQLEHVDIAGQRFRVLIRKGRQEKWVYKTIATAVLPLWQELVSTAMPGDFLFSKGLVPGSKAIRPDQVGRRWTKWVKGELGIQKDLYALKHLHTSMVVDYHGAVAAAAVNSHTTTAMVVNIYDTRNSQRIHNQLKDIPGRL